MSHKNEYKTGSDSIDSLIRDLARECTLSKNGDLIEQMMTTIAKLAAEVPDRGDLKLVNTALKELRYASKIFIPFRDQRKAVIFGSARVKNNEVEYQIAEKVARMLARKDYKVITGGGPGIMEAGNKGAGKKNSFSLNIRLPFEQKLNPYVAGDDKSITFKYFYNRKLFFLKESDATILFPGGFGTLDEGFENLTLIQTGKSKPRPIILIEPSDSQYWGHWVDLVMGVLAPRGYISKSDINLFTHTHSAKEAVEKILEFYRVYHSIRYIGAKTVIRLVSSISTKALQKINTKYKTLLRSGKIEASDPLPEERNKAEFLNLPRLIMEFNRYDYGGLTEMIWELNNL